MCIVVPSYNNRANFRLEYNLNSIFLQNYSNYFAVIINDASTDGSHDLFSRYFDFYRIDPAKFVYVHNKQRRTALENIYSAVWEHCSSDSVVVNLDGDDELIGRNVLKVFNANYQKYKMGVIYSNYYRYHSDGRIEPGWTTDYSQNVKTRLAFRSSSQSFSHLKTHRADLFRRIPIEALQDDSGRFFTITSDLAIYFPLMELACGKVMKIRGHHYLYNFNTGLNDYSVDHRLQLEVERQVRGGKQLPCPS
jgi:glycosyltransferase involved in cell wall biosynthesis